MAKCRHIVVVALPDPPEDERTLVSPCVLDDHFRGEHIASPNVGAYDDRTYCSLGGFGWPMDLKVGDWFRPEKRFDVKLKPEAF